MIEDIDVLGQKKKKKNYYDGDDDEEWPKLIITSIFITLQ